MPTIRSPFLRTGFKVPGSGGGSTELSVTIANSQLTILENELSKDGFLSVADYEKLIKKASELKAGFNTSTQSGRNAIASMEATISNYQSNVNSFNRQKSNVNTLTESLNDDIDVLKLTYSGEPAVFFSEKEKRLEDALKDLDNFYAAAEEAGDIGSMNDYMHAYKEVQNELQVAKTFDERKGSFGAFIVTDPSGVPIDVDYRALTPQNIVGYRETDKEFDGMPLWIYPNSSTEGMSSAVLGKHVFSESDTGAEGDFQSLIAGGQRQRKLVSKNDDEVISDDLLIRTYVPEKAWAQGKDSLYKNLGNNRYIKYTDVKAEDLSIPPQSIQKINRVWENRINESVVMSGDVSLLPEANKLYTPSLTTQPPVLEGPQSVPEETSVEPRFVKTQLPAGQKKEKGGFSRTVQKIWQGLFGGGSRSPEEEQTPAESPGFLDRLQ